ncbi:MAG: ferredoxin--NADP reductase [Magnetococcales bacterium]|nr:ferredoxin--NADP reductase [Magnetococcales bacterium]
MDKERGTDLYNATLIFRQNLTPGLAILRIRPDQLPYRFRAGQFTVLGLIRDAPRLAATSPEESPSREETPTAVSPDKGQRLIRRAYSISSASQEGDYLEFYVSLVSSGELTPRLFHLREGDRLFVGPKATGVFTLDQTPPGSNLVLVATGTGLAPYISMVRTLALGEGTPARNMAILHGASHSWDLGYRSELEGLAQASPGMRYLPIVSRPEEDSSWKGRTGRLQTWVADPEIEKALGFPLSPEVTQVFLCGNPVMVKESVALLEAKGFTVGSRKEPGSLHLEQYW